MLKDHRKTSPENTSCAVITVSDTRTKDTDKSGKLMIDLLETSNHQVNFYEIVQDDKQRIQNAVKQATQQENIEAILINGGTGISMRDVTIESIEPLFDKELPGFGELFRYLSYELDIGSASMLSRATCGVVNNRIVFSTPGSSGAVKLAMEKLILPELGHAVREIKKDLDREGSH